MKQDQLTPKKFLINILRPIVKMVLRNGIVYREFCDAVKKLFVDVATEDFGIKGRPTNISRVSILTGIDRKEVKRVRDLTANQELNESPSNRRDRITRVISAWHQDKNYLDSAGNPIILDVQGTSHSFSQLSKSYAGDIPEGALLKELERSNVVERISTTKNNQTIDQVKIVKREFIPVETDPDAILRASEVFTDLGKTLFHNLYDADEKNTPKVFERRASNSNIDPLKYEEFKQFVNLKGQAFLEEIDQWLTDNELENDDSNSNKGIRLGVSTFLINDLLEDGNAPSKKKP